MGTTKTRPTKQATPPRRTPPASKAASTNSSKTVSATSSKAASTKIVKAAPATSAGKGTQLALGAKAISSAARTRAESLLAEIERRKLRIAEDFYDIGVGLRELSEKKLFGALGFPSFAAMLTDRKVMSLSQAHRLIRIARSLPRDKALAVGSEKAALLTGYSEATSEADTPEWLLDKGTLPGGKPIAEASSRELAAALKKARAAKRKKAPSPEEAAAQAGARGAQAALRKRGAKNATVEVVRRAGTFWLRAEVPVSAAALLVG